MSFSNGIFMLKNDKVRQSLCCLLLAIGCVLWFGNFSIGLPKACVLSLLIISCYKFFFAPPKSSKYLLLLIAMFILSVKITGASLTKNIMLIWGLIENLVLMIIGYHFAKKNLITKKFLFTIILIIGLISSLTITNFILGVPNWTSPMEQLRIRELYELYGITSIDTVKLYSTGFGLGRTGWSASIALFIPICLYCIEQKYHTRISTLLLCCLLGSIFVSGSRGGILAVLFVLLIYFLISLKSKFTKTKLFLLFFAIFILPLGVIYFQDFFIQHLRLDSSDISTGRNDQYILIPRMLDEMGFWGLGINGTRTFLSRYGIYYALHNSYMRNLIDYGWIVGGLIFVYVFYILKISKRVCYSKKVISFGKNVALIILSGLISACFEPAAILGTRSWYVVWWFFLGVLLFYNESRKTYLEELS